MIAAGALVAVGAGCRSTGHPVARVRISHPLSATVPVTTISPSVGLPGGDEVQQSAHALLGAPSGAGVWLLAIAPTGTPQVVEFTPTGPPRMWPVPGQTAAGLDYGLAVGADGAVWVGIGSQLLHLDPATGGWTTVAVPPATPDAAANAARPPQLQGELPINGVAVLADGRVVVSFDTGGELQVLTPSTASWMPVVLPASHAVQGLAASGDTYVVGLAGIGHSGGPPVPNSALIVGPGGQTRQLADGASTVAAGPGVLVAGTAPEAVSEVPVTAAGPGPTTVTPVRPPSGVARPLTDLATLPAGGPATFAYATGAGITVTGPTGSRSFDFPAAPCPTNVGGIAMASPPTSAATAPAAPRMCSAGPAAMAEDGAGDLWYQADGGAATTIGYLTPAQLDR